MKRVILLEVIRKLKSKPHLMRKLKIFAVIGFVGFLITGALTIWAGVAAFNYVATKATEVAHSPVTQMNVESLKTEFKRIPKTQALNCWGKAQSLMAVQPWLERSAIDNLIDLKVVCLEGKTVLCEGHECNQIHTVEGGSI